MWNKQEKIIVAVIIAVVVALTTLPHVVGWALSDDESVYVGINSRTPADTPVYLSMIEDIRQGGLFTSNFFTPEHGDPVFLHPLWIEMGVLSRLTGLSPFVWFQIERILAVMFFILVVYAVLRRVFDDVRDRILALIVILFSFGYGFLYHFGFLTGQIHPDSFLRAVPTDVWVSESVTFLSLYHSALFTLSQLLIFVLVVGYDYAQQKKQTTTWLLGAGLAFLVWMHPYDIVTVVAICGMLELLSANKHDVYSRVFRLATFVVPSLVVVAYYFGVVLHDPSMRGWNSQNITMTPPMQQIIMGYAILLPFALSGAFIAWKRNGPLDRLWVVWAVVSAVVVTLPNIDFARRLMSGWHIPLSILAFTGWQALRDWTKDTKRAFGLWAVSWLAVMVMVLSVTGVVAGDVLLISEKRPPFFVSRDVENAALWLRDHATQDDIIFARPYMGNVMPAFSARRFYIGHGHQTIDWKKRLDEITHTFYYLSPREQRIFLEDRHITYVVTTPEDGEMGPNIPGPGLTEVYSSGDVTVFAVR